MRKSSRRPRPLPYWRRCQSWCLTSTATATVAVSCATSGSGRSTNRCGSPTWSVIGSRCGTWGSGKWCCLVGNRCCTGICAHSASFSAKRSIRLTLLTTGLLLLKRADEVSTLFDDVIVSIDGPREVHDGIRRISGAFDVIAQGVAEILRRKPDLGIACRTTVQKANHRHLRATVKAAKAIGFKSISLLAADLTSEAFNRPLVWPGERQSEIALTEKEVAGLEDEIEQLIVEHGGDIHRGYIAEGVGEAATDCPPVPRASRPGFSRISYLQCSLGFCRSGSRRIGQAMLFSSCSW